jgi:hypothetical protein
MSYLIKCHRMHFWVRLITMNNVLKLLPNEHLRSYLFRIHSQSPFGAFSKTVARFGIDTYTASSATTLQKYDYQLASLVSSDAFETWKKHGDGNSMLPFMDKNELKATQSCFAHEPLQLNTIYASTVHNSLWRFCEDCVEEDYTNYGTTYYHQPHQLAGVFHCYKHSKPLITACNSCGYQLKNISKLPIPPINLKCPACNNRMVGDEGYFDEFMSTIEKHSFALNQSMFAWTLKDVQQANLKYIGFSGDDTKTLAFNRTCTDWYKDISVSIGSHALQRYFSNTKQIDCITVSQTMRTTRMFLADSKNKFSPPLIYLLALEATKKI